LSTGKLSRKEKIMSTWSIVLIVVAAVVLVVALILKKMKS
jgi:CHASE3 domain sensor protein